MFKLPHLRNSIICDAKLSKSLAEPTYREDIHKTFLKRIDDIREWIEGPPEESDDESEYSVDLRSLLNASRLNKKRNSVASGVSRISTRSFRSNRSRNVQKVNGFRKKPIKSRMNNPKKKQMNNYKLKQKTGKDAKNNAKNQKKGGKTVKIGIKLPDIKGGKSPRDSKTVGKITPLSENTSDSAGRQSIYPQEKVHYLFRWSLAVDRFRKLNDPDWMRTKIRPDSSDIRDLVMGLQCFSLDGSNYDLPSSSLWAEKEDDLASLMSFSDFNRNRNIGLRPNSRLSVSSQFIPGQRARSRAGSRADVTLNLQPPTSARVSLDVNRRGSNLGRRSIDYSFQEAGLGRLVLIPEVDPRAASPLPPTDDF